MPNGQVFECYLNTGQPNHLNTGQMDAILFSYVLVQYSNGWSSTQDITHILTILNPNFKKVRYSNVSGIQLPTVWFHWIATMDYSSMT